MVPSPTLEAQKTLAATLTNHHQDSTQRRPPTTPRQPRQHCASHRQDSTTLQPHQSRERQIPTTPLSKEPEIPNSKSNGGFASTQPPPPLRTNLAVRPNWLTQQCRPAVEKGGNRGGERRIRDAAVCKSGGWQKRKATENSHRCKAPNLHP